ncbi:YgaB family protein [Bacillus sp. FJAT-27251]|uniref:YgaB family protein n=1 Tax=Bacillus sp. FJAT-27251 TaxID=1684142 RepID=UPI0006A7E1F0|nr:YgaB family protein [Bacillus sp. FJAT-27251]
MDQFNELVSTQLKTMDKLLYLQSELERCQQIEQQLITLRQNTELEEIREEIDRMKAELKDIHRIFEEQTEEVIRSYQDMNIIIR